MCRLLRTPNRCALARSAYERNGHTARWLFDALANAAAAVFSTLFLVWYGLRKSDRDLAPMPAVTRGTEETHEAGDRLLSYLTARFPRFYCGASILRFASVSSSSSSGAAKPYRRFFSMAVCAICPRTRHFLSFCSSSGDARLAMSMVCSIPPR